LTWVKDSPASFRLYGNAKTPENAVSIQDPVRRQGGGMKKIGIITCHEVSKRCSSSGCFKALHARTGSFIRYAGEEAQIAGFVHCNGCGDKAVEQVMARAERMRQVGVDVIHLSTCIKSRCDRYPEFLSALAEGFDVVGYSHGKKSP
jgi:predicted metal-binding protein